MLPPGPEPRGPGGPDPALPRGTHHRGGGQGLPHLRVRPGPAGGAGQAQDPPGGHRLPGTRSRGAPRAVGGGPGRALPHLQRRLSAPVGGRAVQRGPVRRGLAAVRCGHRTASRGFRAAGPGGHDALPARPTRGPGRCHRRARDTGGAGPLALGRGRVGHRDGPPRSGPAHRGDRSLRTEGLHRRAACRRAALRPHRLGGHRPPLRPPDGVGADRGGAAQPGRGRGHGRLAGLRPGAGGRPGRWPASSRATTSTRPPGPTSCAARDNPGRRPSATGGHGPRPTTSPSTATSTVGWSSWASCRRSDPGGGPTAVTPVASAARPAVPDSSGRAVRCRPRTPPPRRPARGPGPPGGSGRPR